MIKNQFPILDHTPVNDAQSPRNKKGMDLENIRKDSKAAAPAPKMQCAGCDQEIIKLKEDDYFSECSDCSSNFCR